MKKSDPKDPSQRINSAHSRRFCRRGRLAASIQQVGMEKVLVIEGYPYGSVNIWYADANGNPRSDAILCVADEDGCIWLKFSTLAIQGAQKLAVQSVQENDFILLELI